MKSFFVTCLILIACIGPSYADVVIMPIGDSITSGFHGPNPGNYRDEIQGQLTEADVTFDFVGQYSLGFGDPHHQGLGGASIEYMRDNWGGVVKQYQPAFAMVLAGTNNHWDPVDFDRFYQLYDGLVDMIQSNSPDTSIIFSTVPKFGYNGPAEANYWTPAWVNQRNTIVIPNMNSAIYAVAANRSEVAVVDFFSAIDISTDLADGGVHPNLFGHRKLAQLFGDEVLHQIYAVPEPGLSFLGCLVVMVGLTFIRPIRQSTK